MFDQCALYKQTQKIKGVNCNPFACCTEHILDMKYTNGKMWLVKKEPFENAWITVSDTDPCSC